MLEPHEILFMGIGKSAVLWYRAALPAHHLGADWVGVIGRPPGLQVVTGMVHGNTSLPRYEDYKLVVLQQPHGRKWLALIRRLQAMGIKVLYEVDDYLHGVPKQKSHDFARHYSKQVLRDHEMCMRVCDGIICSTDYIARRYAKFNRNLYVCRNGLDVGRYNLTRPPRKTVNFGWSGATGHMASLLPWLNELLDIMGEDSKTCFVAIGQPGLAKAFGDVLGEHRAVGIPFTMLESYPAAMCMIDIALAPSTDSSWYRGKCLDAATRVGTPGGLRPIAELEVGDRVWNGERWRTVLGVHHEDCREGLEIVTRMGYRVKVTGEHRLRSSGRWRRAEDLLVGDSLDLGGMGFANETVRLRIPLLHTGIRSDWSPEPTARALPFLELDEIWAEFLGFFVGDGNVNGKTVRISIDAQDEDVVERVEWLLRQMGLRAIVRDKHTFDGQLVNVKTISASATKLIDVLELLGLLNERKGRRVVVPEIILRSPRRVVAAFLRGYFEADGSVYGQRVELVSKSVEALAAVHQLLLGFGITAQRHEFTGQGKYEQNIYGELGLRKQEAVAFEREIGFLSHRKKNRLARLGDTPDGHRTRQMTMTDEILAIDPCSVEPVDIQVKGEQFCAAGIVSHNSDLRWLEAGALGIPIIADPYVYPDIEHGVTGFHANSPKEMSAIARNLLADEQLRRAVGEAAREYVHRERSMEVMAPQWFEVASAVVGGYESMAQLQRA